MLNHLHPYLWLILKPKKFLESKMGGLHWRSPPNQVTDKVMWAKILTGIRGHLRTDPLPDCLIRVEVGTIRRPRGQAKTQIGVA